MDEFLSLDRTEAPVEVCNHELICVKCRSICDCANCHRLRRELRKVESAKKKVETEMESLKSSFEAKIAALQQQLLLYKSNSTILAGGGGGTAGGGGGGAAALFGLANGVVGGGGSLSSNAADRDRGIVSPYASSSGGASYDNALFSNLAATGSLAGGNINSGSLLVGVSSSNSLVNLSGNINLNNTTSFNTSNSNNGNNVNSSSSIISLNNFITAQTSNNNNTSSNNSLNASLDQSKAFVVVQSPTNRNSPPLTMLLDQQQQLQLLANDRGGPCVVPVPTLVDPKVPSPRPPTSPSSANSSSLRVQIEIPPVGSNNNNNNNNNQRQGGTDRSSASPSPSPSQLVIGSASPTPGTKGSAAMWEIDHCCRCPMSDFDPLFCEKRPVDIESHVREFHDPPVLESRTFSILIQPYGSPRSLRHALYHAHNLVFLFSFENHDASVREYSLLVRQLSLLPATAPGEESQNTPSEYVLQLTVFQNDRIRRKTWNIRIAGPREPFRIVRKRLGLVRLRPSSERWIHATSLGPAMVMRGVIVHSREPIYSSEDNTPA